MKFRFYYLISIIYLIINNICYSQFTGWGNGLVFQASLRLPAISSYPPFYSDMPERTKIAYRYLYNQNHKFDGDYLWKYYFYISEMDTIKKFGSFIFAIHQYNSMVMSGIINQSYYWTIPNDSLLSYPADVFYGIDDAIRRKYENFGKQYYFLILSDFVLKTKIDSVYEGIDSTFDEARPEVNSSGTIIENFFGNKNPCNCKINDFSNADNFTIDTNKKDCINFTYPADLITNTGFDGLVTSSSRIRTVKKNEEYYVFLQLLIISDSLDIIAPIPYFESTGGLFQIINGKVQDSQNFWGLGTVIDEDVFVNHLNQLKSDIESWFDPTLSVNKLINNDKLSYFPNPLHPGESLNLSLSIESAGEVNVSLYDALGQPAGNIHRIYLDAGSHTLQYSDTEELTSGIYFLRIMAGGKVWSEKVVVIK